MQLIASEAGHLVRLIRRDAPTLWLGSLILVMTLAVIGAATLAELLQDRHRLGDEIAYELRLGRDGSFSEVFLYGISFLAASMFLLAFVEVRSRMLLFAAALMGFIWFDDSISYHERFGKLLAKVFELPILAGLREQDTGELLAWSIAGIMLLAVLIWSLRARVPGDLGVLALVMSAFAVLFVFGVVADLLHVVVPAHLQLLIGTIEDGGEMLAIVCLAVIGIGVARCGTAYYDEQIREMTPLHS